MNHIKDLYKKSKSVVPGDAWMQKLVDLMKNLNWSDSIDHLPDGHTMHNENVLLLWNDCEAFYQMYMSDPSKQKRGSRSGS